jgi:phage-related protein
MSLRELEYVGGSQRDLSAFPADVQEEAVFALLEAQGGGKHPDVEPLKGFSGADVLALARRFRGDAYRVVYTIRFPGVVYVLHAFKKKSTKGIETPKRDKDLITRRLKAAAELHARRGST